MTLDVPSWAAKPGFREKTGLQNFDECLACTKFNNQWFADNRLGKTKFLNVLQGTYWDDAEEWYQTVKDYPLKDGEWVVITSQICIWFLKDLIQCVMMNYCKTEIGYTPRYK